MRRQPDGKAPPAITNAYPFSLSLKHSAFSSFRGENPRLCSRNHPITRRDVSRSGQGVQARRSRATEPIDRSAADATCWVVVRVNNERGGKTVGVESTADGKMTERSCSTEVFVKSRM